MKNYKFKIEGLDCANCASTLESESLFQDYYLL